MHLPVAPCGPTKVCNADIGAITVGDLGNVLTVSINHRGVDMADSGPAGHEAVGGPQFEADAVALLLVRSDSLAATSHNRLHMQEASPRPGERRSTRLAYVKPDLARVVVAA